MTLGRGERGVRTELCAWVAMVVVALAGALAPSRAGATTVLHMALAAQATTADRIFVGSVTAVASRPTAAAPKYFETVVTLAVEETVAGSLPATVELTFAGGSLGGMRQQIDGMPTFAVGERYVVMLEADQSPPLASPIVGFNQGLYRVVGANRASAVVRDRQGNPLADAAARSAVGDTSLDDFLDGIRAARGR